MVGIPVSTEVVDNPRDVVVHNFYHVNPGEVLLQKKLIPVALLAYTDTVDAETVEKD